jgi:hypothetical protein
MLTVEDVVGVTIKYECTNASVNHRLEGRARVSHPVTGGSEVAAIFRQGSGSSSR